MILIADSGSTKTSWRLIDDNKKIHQCNTIGFNPYFQSTEDIAQAIKNELLPNIPLNIQDANLEIFFYGAGCSSKEKCMLVKAALKQNFTTAKIAIEHDLLGAARALCGREEGMAAILGTGSNSCFYNGKKIVENVSSLGFIFGDEGSGAHIGKTFITSYLNKELPKEISERFYERFKLSREDILEAVYKKPMPNKYLASFSHFVYQNLKEQFAVDLVASCFSQFFDKHICKYNRHKEVQMGCVGSVGFYFSNILHAVAITKGVVINKIIESPIAALTLYHLEE